MFTNPEHLFGGESELVALIEQLHDTLEDASLWPAALGSISRALGASQSALIFHDARYKGAGIQVSVGIDAQAARDYGAYYGTVDAWFRPDVHVPGWTGVGSDVLPESVLRETEFYSDFLRHHDMLHQCGTVIDRDEARFGTLTLLRGHGQSDFGDRETQALTFLLPHLRRVLRLQMRIAQLESSVSGLKAALEAFDQAVFGLSAEGTILFMNAGATAVARDSGPLRVSGGRLRLQNPQEDRRLQERIAAASAVGSLDASAMIAHGASGRTLRLSLMPHLGQTGDAGQPLAVLVFLNDPISRMASRADLLRILYDLTPAEARLTELLAWGIEPREIAARLSVTRDTLRFHLKNVYRKTKVGRHVDLVRIVVSLPGSTQGPAA